ncbi:hypothetical protein BGW42_000013 [Actinomortierella wolfii]|nr:hypothetical protein BGW42_000013 [Actinomortierella wolfii]
MTDHHGDDSTSSSGILLPRPDESAEHSLASSFVHEDGRQEQHSTTPSANSDADVAQSYIRLESKDLETMGHSVLGSGATDHEGLNAMRQVQKEEKSQHHHQPGEIVSQVSGTSTTRPTLSTANAPSAPAKGSSTALITKQQAAEETSRFWRIMSPIITRETAVWLAKATAINFFLPFINGVFLGFGEICAHELAYRWGWTFSTHVVQAPGRDGQALGSKQEDNKTRGNVSSIGLRSSSGYGYTGSGSGVGGGLSRYESDFE